MFSRDSISEGSGYLNDESKLAGQADHVICPYDESEVREVLRFANGRGVRITVGGSRTGLCGGAVPMGGDVLSTERMKGAVGIGRDGRGYFLRVQAGTTVREINDILLRRDYSGLRDITPGAVEQLRAEPVAWFYPVDPTETEGSIGGNIATNASGPRTHRYGPTRDWIRRIRVTLPEAGTLEVVRGEVKAAGRRLSFPAGRNYYSFELPDYDFNTRVKNAAGPMACEGMDLIDLFIGSEGIFGVVSEADIWLTPWHPLMSFTAFFPSDGDALSAVADMKRDLPEAEFMEFMDSGSLDMVRRTQAADPAMVRAPAVPDGAAAAVFFDLPGDSVQGCMPRVLEILERRGCPASSCWCGHEDQDRRRMRELRHSIPKSVAAYIGAKASEVPGMRKVGTDMAVPDESEDAMMSYYKKRLTEEGLDHVIFGHLADNHPHVNMLPRDQAEFDRARELCSEFAAKAVELGGTASAEHGIGKIKTEYITMMYGREGADAIRRIKSILDPNGVLNIGNLVGGPE